MLQRHLSDLIRHQVPLCLSTDTPVQEACRRMSDRRVGAVLVVGPAGELEGIFTGRDAVGRVIGEARNARSTTLQQVMTRNPTTAAPNATAVECLRLMQDCGCRHVPIVEEGKPVGIVSRGDFRGLEQDRLDEEAGVWERLW